MAGRRRAKTSSRTKATKGRHRAAQRHRQPYAWLGTGAITLGVGAVLVSGSGVAHADTTEAGAEPSSSHTSNAAASEASSSGASHRRAASSGTAGAYAAVRHEAAANTGSPLAAAPNVLDTSRAGSSGGHSRVTTASAVSVGHPGTPVGTSTAAASLSQAGTPSTSAVTNTGPQVNPSAAARSARTSLQPAAAATVTRTARTQTAASTRLHGVVANAASTPTNPIVGVLAGVLSLFGLTGPTAPANPLGALLWGLLRQIETSQGWTPIAGTPTVGTPNFTTGTVTGTLSVTEPAGLPLGYAVSVDPTQGAVSVDASGTYTYTPTEAARLVADHGTTDTFSVIASDGIASITQTVSVPVSPNDKPVAATPTVGTPDLATAVVTGNLGFSDPGGKALSYTVTTAPTQGTVSVTANGGFTYTPTKAARLAAGPATTDTFTVTASDGIGTTPQSVTVSVLVDTPVPGTPTVGTPDAATGTLTGAAQFTDPAGLTLTYSLITNTSHGTVSLDPTTGGYTYTPTKTARLFAGTYLTNTTDTFTVIADNGLATTPETITVPISPTVLAVDAKIALGTANFPIAVALSPDGKTAYLTEGNYLPGTSSLLIIDTTTNTISTTLPIGGLPGNELEAVAVSPDGNHVYVTQINDPDVAGAVLVVDTTTNEVTNSVPVGNTPLGVAVTPNGGKLYVTNMFSGTVSVIDTATHAVTATIAVGTRPYGVAVSPNGKYAYVSSGGQGSIHSTVSVIDTTTDKVVAIIPDIGQYGVAFTPDGRYAYVADGAYGGVSVIDTTTNTVVSAPNLNTGITPWDIAASPTGDLVYVADSGSGALYAADTATNTVVGSLGVGFDPASVAVSPNGKYIYVPNNANGNGYLSVISIVPATSV